MPRSNGKGFYEARANAYARPPTQGVGGAVLRAWSRARVLFRGPTPRPRHRFWAGPVTLTQCYTGAVAHRNTERLTVYISPETMARLSEEAHSKHISLSAHVRKMLGGGPALPAPEPPAPKPEPRPPKPRASYVCTRERFHRPGVLCKECGYS